MNWTVFHILAAHIGDIGTVASSIVAIFSLWWAIKKHFEAKDSDNKLRKLKRWKKKHRH